MLTQLVSKKTVPLCYLPDSKLICYQKGIIVVYNEGGELFRFPLFLSFKECLLGRFAPVFRLMRLGVRSAVAIDDNLIVLSIGNRLFELSINTETLSEGWDCGEGVRALAFTDLRGLKGFDDGIYFGEYCKNDSLEPIKIFHRIDVDKWETVYTFPKGTIKHVHTIVADKYRNCVWIMTGDFGNAAAIWKAVDNFKNVELVVCGEQKWRGCVGYAVPEGLLYATDTPFSDNHIFLLKPDGTIETIADISGSCIYGCQWKGKYVFSSTVEADGRDETIWKLLSSKKRGGGIKDDYVRLYIGDIADGFKEVYKEKKDWLPFIFQFGVFKFPAGLNNSDTLYFQPIATKKNDLKLLSLKWDGLII